MKNIQLSKSIKAIGIALNVLLALHANYVFATPIEPGQGISFEQVAFDYEGLSPVPYSQYGAAFADYAVLSQNGYSDGFINVVSGDQWLVQNLPVSSVGNYPGLSTLFDLGAAANDTPVLGLSAYADFSATPLMDKPVGGPSTFDQTNGNFASTLVTGAQGDGANRPANPGAPAVNGGVKFADQTVFGGFQPGHNRSVEQDDNQCGPAALANSLQYLHNRYNLLVPQQNIPGIAGNPPNSLVGQIDNRMTRAQGETISNEQFINGKLGYLANANIKGLLLDHQGGDGAIGAGNVVASGLTSVYRGAVTANWIINELKKGEDVEMNIRWTGGGGHWVDLIGGGYIGGVPWVAFVHDSNQGYDAVNDKTALNGGTGLFDGGYGFSFLTTDQNGNVMFRNWVDGSTARVNFVVAESIPEPSMPMLLAMGLLLLGYGRISGVGARAIRIRIVKK